MVMMLMMIVVAMLIMLAMCLLIWMTTDVTLISKAAGGAGGGSPPPHVRGGSGSQMDVCGLHIFVCMFGYAHVFTLVRTLKLCLHVHVCVYVNRETVNAYL